MYFEKIPTLGFKYGTKEYVSSKDFNLTVNDLVIWTLSNPYKPLVGEIEFLGKPRSVTSAGSDMGTVAVVKWNQPTCCLPGHVANMKGNKNVVPVNQLVKKGSEQFCLNVNSFHGDTRYVELIGNCVANQHGIREERSNQICPGKPVVILANNKSISGAVEVYCILNAFAETEKYVGVKLVKSLTTLYPKVQVKHAKNVQSCSECASNTLVFIRLDLLSIIGKDIHDFTKISLVTPSIPAGYTAVDENSPVINEEPTIETTSIGMLIGNCVAHGLKLDNCTVENIRTGSTVLAKSGYQTAKGRIIKVCKIHGLENVTSNCYAGVSFNIPLGKLLTNQDTVQHKNLGGKGPSTCKICDGGRLIFINTDILNNESDIVVDGVVFKIN